MIKNFGTNPAHLPAHARLYPKMSLPGKILEVFVIILVQMDQMLGQSFHRVKIQSVDVRAGWGNTGIVCPAKHNGNHAVGKRLEKLFRHVVLTQAVL